MLISDWSSDVCSSDLFVGVGQRACSTQHLNGDECVGGKRVVGGQGDRSEGERRATKSDRPRPLDRKSVGSGKSVSVRVDLGGRRSIKKRNKVCEKTTYRHKPQRHIKQEEQRAN